MAGKATLPDLPKRVEITKTLLVLEKFFVGEAKFHLSKSEHYELKMSKYTGQLKAFYEVHEKCKSPLKMLTSAQTVDDVENSYSVIYYYFAKATESGQPRIWNKFWSQLFDCGGFGLISSAFFDQMRASQQDDEKNLNMHEVQYIINLCMSKFSVVLYNIIDHITAGVVVPRTAFTEIANSPELSKLGETIDLLRKDNLKARMRYLTQGHL